MRHEEDIDDRICALSAGTLFVFVASLTLWAIIVYVGAAIL